MLSLSDTFTALVFAYQFSSRQGVDFNTFLSADIQFISPETLYISPHAIKWHFSSCSDDSCAYKTGSASLSCALSIYQLCHGFSPIASCCSCNRKQLSSPTHLAMNSMQNTVPMHSPWFSEALWGATKIISYLAEFQSPARIVGS